MSKFIPIFTGIVEKGRLTLDDKVSFMAHLLSLKGPVQLTIEKRKKHRSIEQNAYYWGVVVRILADDIGYNDEEMHEALKWKFLRKDGKIPTVRSTASMNTLEFEKYLEDIRVWASTEMGITIPLPKKIADNYKV